MSVPQGGISRLKIWGVRGSIPVPGPTTLRYGGNTSCVELRVEGQIIILDAGTGIRELGLALEKEFGPKPIKITLLITHVHWDHIHGFPFFAPSYNRKNQIHILGYDGAKAELLDAFKGEMTTPFFPVDLSDLPGKINIQKLESNDFKIGNVRVRSNFLNHPGVCVGYRVFTSTGSIAYLPDNESFDAHKLHSAKPNALSPEQIDQRAEEGRAQLVEFLRGSDILLLDSQYTDKEYQKHIGWGHGSLSSAVNLAVDAGVKKLILFHHDPDHDDNKIDSMLADARKLAEKSGADLKSKRPAKGRS